MRISLLLLTLGLWLGCSACQSGRSGASALAPVGGGSGMEDNATGYGHGESGTMDYQQKLSDPGPF